MAMNALNAVFEMFENYDGMVLIRDLEDEGSDRMMFFNHYILYIYDSLVLIGQDPQNNPVGQVSNSNSRPTNTKKRGRPVRVGAQVPSK